MEPITQSEYFTQCQEIATEAVKEAEGDRERAYDLTHESVDGHQWIIYTYYNVQVLTHSSHQNAYFEETGEPLAAESYSDAMVKMAFYAMHADVSEYLETALTEYEEAKQESESAHE